MPTEITHIEDAEELIRRVPAGYECQYDPDSGELIGVPSVAFADRSMQPSVDRRLLLEDLESAKNLPSDGLLKLIAFEVRAITFAQVINGKVSDTQKHTTDAKHSPIEEGNADALPPNPAHSHIEITPQMSKTRFESKMRERLARIALKHGWVARPGTGANHTGPAALVPPTN